MSYVKSFATENETDFEKEMNNRFAAYENGTEKGYTLTETETYARQAYKASKK